MEYYDPKTNRFPYPEDTDQHYLHVKKDDGTVFDEAYPYVNRGKWFRFKRFLFRVFLVILIFPVTAIRLGLRVEGRKNLKKHKDEIKKGVVSCCNHVHLWDYLAILIGIRPKKPHVLIWAPNIRGEFGGPMRLLGGIPIPEGDVRASVAYARQTLNMIKEGGWLHIYPEGSMWEYYAPIRPFKCGAAYFSVKTGRPIIPLAISYRRPNWIRRKIFRQFAVFTLSIGEPIYPNPDLRGAASEEDLTKRTHEAICRLAHIDPEQNIYPPVFDGSKRVDYYTTEYGVGYKGSH